MKSNLQSILIAVVCLAAGVAIGMLVERKKSYHYLTRDSPVAESNSGISQLVGFFKGDSPWRGGYTKTDGQNEIVWHAFFNADGEKEGPSITYWPAGNVRQINHYRQGKMHGQYIVFYESGKLNVTGHYKDGELVDNKFYD